jgi:hypothetical protein
MHYSLLTFDWSTQHGFNIGAIVGFFVAFSFVMTVVTPLLLVVVNFIMALSWRKIDLFKDKEQDRENGVPQMVTFPQASCESPLITTKNSTCWIGLISIMRRKQRMIISN